MKKPNITPGEWEQDGNEIIVQVSHDWWVHLARSTAKDEGHREANAQAISAVPEMLDALMESRKELETWIGEFAGTGAELEETKRVLSVVESALEKVGCTDE